MTGVDEVWAALERLHCQAASLQRGHQPQRHWRLADPAGRSSDHEPFGRHVSSILTRISSQTLGFHCRSSLNGTRCEVADGAMKRPLLSPMMMLTSSFTSGVFLVAAGVYQITPLKRACLVACRSPLAFITRHWRAGGIGAFRMGVEHGASCVSPRPPEADRVFSRATTDAASTGASARADPKPSPSLQRRSCGILGGVAFAPNGDVWSSECVFYGTRLHRFARQSTYAAHGTTLHAETIVDLTEVLGGAAGCGLVNHPDGFMYSNSSLGWKLDAATGMPVGPGLMGGAQAVPGNALGIPVDPQGAPANVVAIKSFAHF